MKFYIADETNIKWNKNLEFFIYGGLVVDESEVRFLSKELLKIKDAHGIHRFRPIKWNNKKWASEPPLESELFKQIKQEILELVGKSEMKSIFYLSPQDFYHRETLLGSFQIRKKVDKQQQCTTHRYALNVCAHKFNGQLACRDEYGMIIADSFEESLSPDLQNHVFKLYCDGGDFSDLRRIILPVMETKEELSLIHQINDVVLGAVSYSLQEMTESLLPGVKSIFYESGASINIYPKNTESDSVKKSLKSLDDKINRLVKPL